MDIEPDESVTNVSIGTGRGLGLVNYRTFPAKPWHSVTNIPGGGCIPVE